MGTRVLNILAGGIPVTLGLLGLGGCGSGLWGPGAAGLQGKPHPDLPARRVALVDVLAQIDASAAPEGVSPDVYAALCAALKQALAARGLSELASGPPLRDRSVAPLSWDQVNGRLTWFYTSQGDYDQNGEVNLGDIVPIAAHFKEATGSGPFDEPSVCWCIDGDWNGEINLGDIPPIAVNWYAQAVSYRIYHSSNSADIPASPDGPNGVGTKLAGTMLLSDAQGDRHADRLRFTFTPAGHPPLDYFWVRPVDSTGAQGIASNAVRMPGYQSVQLLQVDHTLDGAAVTNSPSGSVLVTYTGAAATQYFNLSVEGRWAIRNIPVLPFNGVGATHEVYMGFDLGVSAGTDVTSINAAASLTAALLGAPPSPELAYPVGTRVVIMTSGRPGGTGGLGGKQASLELGDEVGGTVVDSANHGSPMPNQNCGDGQCAAAGVSNSLNWLADEYLLPIGDNANPPGSKPIDIPTVDGVVGATARTGTGWANVKANWLKTNGYSVETSGIPGTEDLAHEATTAECDAAMQALKDGKDVEVDGERHVAALVGMAKLQDGRYVMYVVHDTDQGVLPDHAGGQAVEKVIYDPKAALKEAQGGWGFDGWRINGFVVEGPVTTAPLFSFFLSQISVTMDTVKSNQTATGSVKLTYTVPADQEYFNLVVNGDWVVRNFPLPPLAAAGKDAEIDLPINLGVPEGTALSLYNYATEMDSMYLSAPPSGAFLDTTTQTDWNFTSGEDGIVLTYPGAPPADLWQPGVPLVGGAFHQPDSVVNQDCGDNECAPVAISNSLKTLKNLHPADMAGLSDDPGSTTDDTDIDTMKPATGWDALGAPTGPIDDPGTWWNLKDAWMDAHSNYPIDTTISTTIGDVVAALTNGSDVELRVPGHVVMVIGATQMPNGDVILVVAHDTDQGPSPDHDGGTVTEPVYFNAATGTLSGSATFNGQTIAGGVIFVIEAVVVPPPDTTIECNGSANFPVPLGAGTATDPYWAVNTETHKFTVTHISLGDVTSDPNTTYDLQPPSAGTLAAGILTLDPAFTGTFTVSSQYKGQLSAPGLLHFTVYTRKDDSVFAWPAATTAHDGDHVRITVYCYKTMHPFLYLNSVRITAELGTLYVSNSFNVGSPGGAVDDVDGVWVAVNPANGFLLPPDMMLGFNDIGGGRAAGDFNVTPLNGTQIPSDASGALFNFELEAHSDIHFGIDRGGAPKRTYYSDDSTNEYFWSHDDNAGAPGITLVP